MVTEARRSGLFAGSTWHGRKQPIRHDFRYRTWSVLLDLDTLEDTARRVRMLAVDRRGLCSVRTDDHVLPLDGDAVRGWLEERGVDARGGHVSLLTSPRVLGHAFNPLSLWWYHADDGDLTAVIAEVHNTYGGRHAYLLLPDRDGRASVDKALYVSPFFDVDGRYVMRLRHSPERFDVHIGYEREGERVFDATWQGRRQPLTDARLLPLLLAHPLWALRVTALIRWQGIRLWLRRLTVVPRPERAAR